MQQDLINMMVEVNKTATESLRKLSDINIRSYESAVKQQLDVANLLVETGLGSMELARGVKDLNGVADYLARQGDLAQKTAERLVGMVQDNVKVANETRDELMKWMEEGVAEAAKIKPVSPPAAATAKKAAA